MTDRTKVVEMTMKKATKNTVVFEAVQRSGEPPAVTTLYVQGWAVPDGHADRLTVTLEWGEDDGGS